MFSHPSDIRSRVDPKLTPPPILKIQKRRHHSLLHSACQPRGLFFRVLTSCYPCMTSVCCLLAVVTAMENIPHDVEVCTLSHSDPSQHSTMATPVSLTEEETWSYISHAWLSTFGWINCWISQNFLPHNITPSLPYHQKHIGKHLTFSLQNTCTQNHYTENCLDLEHSQAILVQEWYMNEESLFLASEMTQHT